MMFWGADTAQLSKRATATHGGAARLETLLETIEQVALSTEWTGADAESFRTRARAEVARGLAAADLLRGLGAELTGHSDEQDDASDGDDGQGVPAVAAALTPETQDELDSLLADALHDGGLEDLRGNSRDLDALAERLAELTPEERAEWIAGLEDCLLYTSPSPRD